MKGELKIGEGRWVLEYSAILGFIESVSKMIHSEIPGEILGVYRTGSLAHGGFNSRYSDISIAFVTGETCDDSLAQRIWEEAQSLDRDLGPRLSLLWTDRSFSSARFSILDQVDFLDHRSPVVESFAVEPRRPELNDIRMYLRGAPLELWRERTEYFQKKESLAPEDHKEFLRCLIYPARLVYTWSTGKVASCDDAVQYFMRRANGQLPLRKLDEFGPALEPILQGLFTRNARANPDQLFWRFRRSLNTQFSRTLRWIEESS